MKKLLTVSAVVLGVIVMFGCGKDGGGGGDTGTVTGTVYAPNGTDPVANAVVYVPENPEALSTLGIIPQAASTCENPGTSVKTKTCTGADGSFSLVNVPAGKTKIVIAKGLFKKSIVVNVKVGETTT